MNKTQAKILDDLYASDYASALEHWARCFRDGTVYDDFADDIADLLDDKAHDIREDLKDD